MNSGEQRKGGGVFHFERRQAFLFSLASPGIVGFLSSQREKAAELQRTRPLGPMHPQVSPGCISGIPPPLPRLTAILRHKGWGGEKHFFANTPCNSRSSMEAAEMLLKAWEIICTLA